MPDSLSLVAAPLLSILSCALALAGCTREDSLGNNTRQDASPDLEVVTRDSGPTPDETPLLSDSAVPGPDAGPAPDSAPSLEVAEVATPALTPDGPGQDSRILRPDGQYTAYPDGRRLLLVDYCLPILPIADASRYCPATLAEATALAASPPDGGPVGAPPPTIEGCKEPLVKYLPHGRSLGWGEVCYYDVASGQLVAMTAGTDTPTECLRSPEPDTAAYVAQVYGQWVTCAAAPTPDAGPPTQDVGGGDAGASPFDALAAEAAIPTDAAAPTSYTILATLKSLRLDGGVPFPESALPSTHRFSLLVDWAGGAAVTGSGGTSNKVNLVQAGGEWTAQGALVLATAIATNWPEDGTTSMGRPYVSYERITLHPTADGCAGHATGKYLGAQSDTLFDIPFEAELAGGIDGTGPEISVVPASTKAIHPLDLEAVAAGELLPPGTSARWVSTDGIAVPMTSLPPDGSLGISGFLIGDRALAFATSYRLDVLPAAMDLAGNLTGELPVLATITGPGFFAQDGFEGPVDAILGGGVKVVDATSLPIPAGKKAIRFAPTSYGTTTDTTCEDRFTARLAVAPTAKAVKVSALSYRSSRTMMPFIGWLRLAAPNGAVSDFGMYGMTSKTTPLPNPWSGPLPGAEVNTYGELTQVELPLPAGTASEVIFDLYRFCTEPMLPGDGLIIDDLRVE